MSGKTRWFLLALLSMLLAAAALAQTPDAAVYVATYIDVQVASVDRGMSLIKQYREQSRAEKGNSSMTVVQEIGRPNRFVIIEVWMDQSAFDSHERSGHTSAFRKELQTIHNSPFDERVHRGFAIDSRPRATEPDVMSVVTHVDVPPNRTAETEVLLKSLAEDSRKDEGNVRYEVFQQAMSRNHFTVFAQWKNAKAFESHERQAHTVRFREAIGPMLGAPYDERLYKFRL